MIVVQRGLTRHGSQHVMRLTQWRFWFNTPVVEVVQMLKDLLRSREEQLSLPASWSASRRARDLLATL